MFCLSIFSRLQHITMKLPYSHHRYPSLFPTFAVIDITLSNAPKGTLEGAGAGAAKGGCAC